ncbi:MAG TPA: pyrroline-5-carboxylate reductase [Steroidobacteraceae bacterium]|jgi:pyrroline-5-carboxylate reductase|nr:pyrroline-5-carboxylate reductase [Steroidobacteraceae bacterium]
MPAMDQGSTDRIGFIGGGNMARALIAGLIRQGLPAQRICVGEPDTAARAALTQAFNVTAVADNAAAMHGAALVVLAVKPQDALAVLQELRGSWGAADTVLLSIAAGLTIDALAGVCPPGTAIVRAMPNRPALVGAGITGLYAPAQVGSPQRARAERIAEAAGSVVWLRSEAELDVVTALSGSGPAYFFLLAELLAQAGATLGLPADTATLLAVQTLYGAGLLAQRAAVGAGRADGAALAHALAEERRAVTSKGGTTEAALRVLQEGGLDALIARALRAAAARSAELAVQRAPSAQPR